MKKTLIITIGIYMLLNFSFACSKKRIPTEIITISSTATATRTAISTQNATQTEVAVLISVPGGTFTQTDGYNSFSHTISSFKIGKYQVTYDLWYTVKIWAGANGYVFANAGREGYDGIRVSGAAPTSAKYEPVTTINWRDVIIWCNAYSQMTGLTPVYCSDAGYATPIKISTNNTVIETVLGTIDNPYVNWSANGYRLPTEGEYQYAASYIDGSSWTPYNYASGAGANYTDAAACTTVAWYSANSGGVTHAVGGKTANALGIYDMSGNVMEWCWDWYVSSYPGPSIDYRGPANGSYRVIRGGHFSVIAANLQIGGRFNLFAPYDAYYYGGSLRFARTY